MHDLMPFVILGLSTGGVYALAALGLVITYTTSGLFNFGQGAIAMVAAYVFYSLRTHSVPDLVAILIAVVLVGPFMGVLIDRVLLRWLRGSSATTFVVISIGLLVALQGTIVAIYGPDSKQTSPIFPTSTFSVAGVQIGYDQLSVFLIAVVAAAGLVVLFRYTHLGLKMRAVVDAPDLSGLVGANPGLTRTFSWMLGCAFAALSGVLLVPFVGLNTVTLIILVVQAFGAAVIGRLVSLPLAFLGALIIGIAAEISTKYVTQVPTLNGVPPSLPFIVLFLVLVASPRGRFRDVVGQTSDYIRKASVPPLTTQMPAAAATLAAAAFLPAFLDSSHLVTAITTVVFVLVFASLALLVGLARQLSLCHAAFVGLGATTTAHLVHGGVPFVIALPLAGIILVPLGALVAIPAIRLSGLYLALATFGFGVLVQSLVFPTAISFGLYGQVSIGRPSLFGWSLAGDTAYYYFTLIVVALGCLLVALVARSRLGRLLRALADSEVGVESLGITPTTSRVIVFCISTFLAAAAGGLLAGSYRSFGSGGFDYFHALLWVTLLVAVGVNGLSGSVIAAILLVAVPSFTSSGTVTTYQPVVFGVLAILLAQTDNGIVGLLTSANRAIQDVDSSWRLTPGPWRSRLS